MIADPLPDWLDLEAWAAFKDMRKAKGKRCPFTALAEKRLLFELDLLRVKGHASGPVLWQSVVAGWSSVYPLKHVQQGSTVESIEVEQTRRLIADQAAHKAKTVDESKVKEHLEKMERIKQSIRSK